MNRREFVAAGAGATASLIAVTRLARTEDAPRPPASRPITLRALVADRRFQSSQAFAHAARELPVPLHTIDGDVTAVWFNVLQPLWIRGDDAVAGMTTRSALFVLEQLAWDHWQRVILRIEHRRSAVDGVVHQVTATSQALPSTCTALARRTDWASRVLVPMRLCVTPGGSARRSATVAGAGGACDPLHREPLVSWVIAA